MIRVTLTRDPLPFAPGSAVYPAGLSFTIAEEHAPALRSALEELRNILGGRLEGVHPFAREDALTRAAAAVGDMAAGFNAIIPAGDPDYE
jgi:hypothetical protein